MKKISKIVALLLAMMLIVSVVVGCNNSSSTSENSSSASEVSNTESSSEESSQVDSSESSTPEDDTNEEVGSVVWSDEWKYDEQITITTIRETSAADVLAEGETWADNKYYKAYRDLLNINVENAEELVGTDSYFKRIGELISGANLPDFAEMTVDQYDVAYRSGLLLDITSAYNAYGTDLLKAEVETIDIYNEVATRNGKVYALPKASIAPLGMLYIRGDLREDAGVSAESLNTLQGFVTLAEKLKASKNTVGFSGSLDQNDEWGSWWIMNCFGAYKGIWSTDADGKVVYGSVQPEMRTALEYMAELYTKGLLDKNFDKAQASDTISALANGKLAVANGKQWAPASLPDADTWVEVYPYPSASDTNGAKAQSTVYPQTVYAVSAECIYPEAVVLVADFYIEKTWNTSDKDEHATYASKGAAAINMGNLLEHYWIGLDIAEQAAGNKTADELNVETQNAVTGLKSLFGENGSITKTYTAIVADGMYMMNHYNGIHTTAYSMNWEKLCDRENSLFIDIIKGDADITAFDDFVAWWGLNGGNKISEEVGGRY